MLFMDCESEIKIYLHSCVRVEFGFIQFALDSFYADGPYESII